MEAPQMGQHTMSTECAQIYVKAVSDVLSHVQF